MRGGGGGGGGGIQLLRLEKWAGCPAAYSGYIGRVSSSLQWVHGKGVQLLFMSIRICTKLVYTAQSTVYFTRIYHHDDKVWLQFYTMHCKFLLSPFVMCFRLGVEFLRGSKGQ